MKKKVLINLVFGLLFGLFLISVVNAGFNIGNPSHSIPINYGSGEALSGWFNISLDNEPSDSLLTGFDGSINIFDFLNENSVSYDCIPENCEKGYVITGGEGGASKSFSDSKPSEWLVGMKLNGQISIITDFSLDVDTNVRSFCLNPLKIDIGDDNSFEFISTEVVNEVCIFGGAYGCFENFNTSKIDLKTDRYYCEEIELPAFKSFRIGAVVDGNGAAKLEMLLLLEEEPTCIISLIAGGEVSCDVNLTDALTEKTKADICIKKISGVNYKIKFEDDNSCGQVKDLYLDYYLDFF